mgnify:CR=1 FL=1|jgi:Uncharacterized proteins of the AP superfamily
MLSRTARFIHLLFLVFAVTVHVVAQPSGAPRLRTLIVFFDGLRPDYITPTHMPNLYAFKQQGAFGNKHHSVYPSVTRLNAASYITGSYPRTHGILGNTIYVPEASAVKTLNTGDAKDLMKVAEATHGNLLTAVSLAELLEKAGKSMMVFSSGSTGQAFLQNHKVKGGGIINTDMILPESLRKMVISDLGAPPAKSEAHARHKWATDALLKYGLKEDGPDVCALWMSDPDGSAHAHGMGSEQAVQALSVVDAQFGRILAGLASRGLKDRFNIIVSADHGFVTYKGKEKLGDFLIRKGFKKNKESDDVVVADGAIYVKNKNRETIKAIVHALQQETWVGALFTQPAKAGDTKGWVDGTLSFDAVHWNHAGRAADILMDRNWDDSKNSAGIAGAGYSVGVAGHGGLSPYEIKIALIASGPSFKKQYVSEIPTSNIDIVPTVLTLHGIPVPASMDGRPFRELMVNQPAGQWRPKEATITTKTSHDWGSYELQLKVTQYGKYRYIDYSTVIRKTNEGVSHAKR